MEQNYETYTYLTVTLAPNSPYNQSPEALATIHPLITLVGQVGSLDDVQLLSVPKQEWAQRGEEVLASLKAAQGVHRVDVQSLRQRSKRDEL
ncbi:uncharacterized protein BT62DRAFT_925688 [Guyanagaster necrorhizus]|uniref:Uncharacterized protein n=1 Tax=Guyanagaster necrorhizus TaxID=856835 RepID=A0A9P7W727_9AGAR|nr:uncharacterized protein BT62DRAFT_925688 [Guyanagaster necrorhizus MCA 3950]KAG7453150.1 hypothetical protein BT62DRAFT_925688 [Guyanagaster necrorhizus MCA 3950]